MKIVYDNIVFSLQKTGGISVYWTELLGRMQHTGGFVCTEMPHENLVRGTVNCECGRESSLPVRILRYLPYTKKIEPGSVFHSSYYRTALQKDVINIVTVHDFTYEKFRKGLPRIAHSIQKSAAIRNADGIICVSENTRKDLMHYYPDLRIPVRVIYNGVSKKFHVLKQRRPPDLPDVRKPYILFVGQRSYYKNFNVAVETMKLLPEWHLVAAGGGPLSAEEKRLTADLKDRFVHLQNVSDEKLNLLYNHAYCFVHLSSYEGFGIPVLEAMKAGCPVVALNASAVPEIAGYAALLLDTLDPAEAAAKIRSLEDSSFRNSLIRKGLERSAEFSWDRCFRETFSFYKEIQERQRK